MATWFPDGVNSGDAITPIVPGGYAVVGKLTKLMVTCALKNQYANYPVILFSRNVPLKAFMKLYKINAIINNIQIIYYNNYYCN